MSLAKRQETGSIQNVTSDVKRHIVKLDIRQRYTLIF